MIFGLTTPAVNYKIPTFFNNYPCDARGPTTTNLACYYSPSESVILGGSPSTLVVSKFRLSPNLIFTIPMWFARISEFLADARVHNYSCTDVAFPLPVFEDQELANFFIYVLYILNNLGLVDVSPINAVTQTVVRVLLKTGLECVPIKHRNLVLDLCFQLVFRPNTNDNASVLKVFLDVLTCLEMAPHKEMICAIFCDLVDPNLPEPSAAERTDFYAYCSSLRSDPKWKQNNRESFFSSLRTVYKPLISYFPTLCSDLIKRTRDIEAAITRCGLHVLIMHHTVKLPASAFFKKQARLSSQRCTIFLEDTAFCKTFLDLQTTHENNVARKNIFLLSTNQTDEIVFFRVQLPRRLREDHTIHIVDAGPFQPETFFDRFYTAIANTSKSSTVQIPIFSGLTWQDCLLLLEMFFVTQYMAVPPSQTADRNVKRIVNRPSTPKIKIVDMTKAPRLSDGGDRRRMNLLTTYNVHLLMFYHVWYLYNHQRPEVLSYSWQPQLFNRPFLQSYESLARLANASELLTWVFKHPLNFRLSSFLRVRPPPDGPDFGPFTARNPQSNVVGKFFVSYQSWKRKNPLSSFVSEPVECSSDTQTYVQNGGLVRSEHIWYHEEEEEAIEDVDPLCDDVVTDTPDLIPPIEPQQDFYTEVEEDDYQQQQQQTFVSFNDDEIFDAKTPLLPNFSFN